MFWQPDRKKLSSYNNLLFEKEKQSTSRKGKNARKRQSMAINQPQGQEHQEAAKHGDAGSILTAPWYSGAML